MSIDESTRNTILDELQTARPLGRRIACLMDLDAAIRVLNQSPTFAAWACNSSSPTPNDS